MKAFIVEGPGTAAIREVPTPEPEADELLIRVRYAGICGTDLAIWSGESSFVKDGRIRIPCRIGHEWSGVVERVGSGVTDLRPGDPVVSDNVVSCGCCARCKAGDWENCQEGFSVGTINCWDGSFAQFMLMPRRHVYPLPREADLENAALLEPASIAYGGVEKCHVGPEDTVLVIGTGAIGLAAVALARHRGAKTVILAGRTPSKLAAGERMGATQVVNVREPGAVERIRALTGGGASCVMETSGAVEGAHLGIDAAAREGRLALIGFYERELDGVKIDDIVAKELELKGVMGKVAYMRAVHGILCAGGLDLTPMISRRVAFEELPEVFATAGADRNRIKIMAHMA